MYALALFNPVFGDAARKFSRDAYLCGLGLPLNGLAFRFEQEESDKGQNDDDDDDGTEDDRDDDWEDGDDDDDDD